MANDHPKFLNRLLLRPALATRLRVQRAIEEAGFDDFRIAHINVFAWLPDTGARIGELARQAQLSKQTMTELVSYLEQHGYVYRTHDSSDGRAWIIRFTPRGAALDQVARRALQETEKQWARALGQRAYKQLRNQLERLLELAEADLVHPSLADLSDHRPLSKPTGARTKRTASHQLGESRRIPPRRSGSEARAHRGKRER